MDVFWCSRCLNNRIDLPNMIWTFASGTTASLVANNVTKKLSQLYEDGFLCSRCLNDRIKVPDMMRLFSGGATTPLVVKIWTKQPWVKIENLRDFDCDFALSRGKIWLWRVAPWTYSFNIIWIFLIQAVIQKYQLSTLCCYKKIFLLSLHAIFEQ